MFWEIPTSWKFQVGNSKRFEVPIGSKFQVVRNSKWSKFQEVKIPSGKNSKWNSNWAQTLILWVKNLVPEHAQKRCSVFMNQTNLSLRKFTEVISFSVQQIPRNSAEFRDFEFHFPFREFSAERGKRNTEFRGMRNRLPISGIKSNIMMSLGGD